MTLLLVHLSVNRKEISSPVTSHQDMNYFVLDLEANAPWRYTPPLSHDVAWACVFDGAASIAGTVTSREIVVLDGEGDIAFAGGDSPTRILIGSACKHPHELVMGPSSVHTNAESLQRGHTRIRAIGESLAQQGLLRK